LPLLFIPNRFVRKIRFHFAKGNTERVQRVNLLVVFQTSAEDFPNTLLLKIRNEKQLKTADKRFNEPICV